MVNRPILRIALLSALLAMGFAPATQAASATGTTTFNVILQPAVVLDYYGTINLTIPSSALSTLSGGPSNSANTAALTAAVAGTSLTANAALATTGNSVTAVPLDISNAFSVRAIDTPGSTPGTTSVTVAFGSGSTATLTNTVDSTSTIGLSTPGTGFTTLSAGTGLSASAAVYGDVSMVLNLGAAKSAGTYSGATIVVTATST